MFLPALAETSLLTIVTCISPLGLLSFHHRIPLSASQLLKKRCKLKCVVGDAWDRGANNLIAGFVFEEREHTFDRHPIGAANAKLPKLNR